MKKHLRSMLTMLCMVVLGIVGANAQTTYTVSFNGEDTQLGCQVCAHNSIQFFG